MAKDGGKAFSRSSLSNYDHCPNMIVAVKADNTFNDAFWTGKNGSVGKEI